MMMIGSALTGKGEQTMPDREKVMKEAEEAIDILAKAEEPTFWMDFVRCAFENTLALLKEQETMMQCIKGKCRICPHCANCDVDDNGLLKEQEAVEPRRIDGKRNHFIKCGNCNYDLVTGYLFCPHCGQAVKWDE